MTVEFILTRHLAPAGKTNPEKLEYITVKKPVETFPLNWTSEINEIMQYLRKEKISFKARTFCYYDFAGKVILSFPVWLNWDLSLPENKDIIIERSNDRMRKFLKD